MSRADNVLPNSPVGIFDSGVGGISIANAVSRLLPNEDIIYVADSAHAPYGDKPPTLVLDRCRRIVDHLLEQNVKLIVVACNTATLTCIGKLRALYAIDFVGVEPGIKPALQATQSGVVGVMATQNTLSSPQYAQLQSRFAGQSTLINQPCNGLVEQIESLQLDAPETLSMLNKFLQPMLQANADHIVLGCTHYGFLAKQIEAIAGRPVQLINTSEAIAKQVENRLNTLSLLNTNTHRGASKIYSSLMDETTQKVCATLWQGDVTDVAAFDINS